MTAAGYRLAAVVIALWCAAAVVVDAGWDEPCTARWDRCR